MGCEVSKTGWEEAEVTIHCYCVGMDCPPSRPAIWSSSAPSFPCLPCYITFMFVSRISLVIANMVACELRGHRMFCPKPCQHIPGWCRRENLLSTRRWCGWKYVGGCYQHLVSFLPIVPPLSQKLRFS